MRRTAETSLFYQTQSVHMLTKVGTVTWTAQTTGKYLWRWDHSRAPAGCATDA